VGGALAICRSSFLAPISYLSKTKTKTKTQVPKKCGLWPVALYQTRNQV
jgi:hypothetical protein